MLREVHEHFDANDVRTGYTVVTRDPLWTDDDRERAFGLESYEGSLCPCGCGVPIVESTDESRPFKVEVLTCYATRAKDRERRKAEERAKATNQPDHWAVGKTWYIDTTFKPDEKGATRG